MGARTNARVLTYDLEAADWALAENATQLTRDQRSLLGAHLVETTRDLVDELTRRGSAVRRVLSDLEVPTDEREEIEAALEGLGQQIVKGSSTLAAVKQALEQLETTVGSLGRPALNPLPVRLEELARSVAIDMDAGTGALPIRLHGSGARSLASLQVQSVLYDRRLGVDGTVIRPHPVTLIEEPEAHLHPQATFEVARLLEATRGQVIASTHSAHLVTTVSSRSIRLLRQEEAASVVVDLTPVEEADEATPRARRPALHVAEMEKLKRLVERPFGELLFSGAVVIGDGATERAFLPPVLRHALGVRGHAVCVIDPGSMGSELAIAAVKFAKLVGIPWILFSDADEQGKEQVERLIGSHGDGDASLAVFGGASRDGMQRGATEAMLVQFDEDLCRSACRAVNPELPEASAALDLLRATKGSAGSSLAQMLLERYPDVEAWPEPLRELVRRLEEQL
jgi:putative ATP-dependent endonuclease of OLD family